MPIVCGKCGSENVFGHQGVVEVDGLTEPSLSCLSCGNTSESKKYGFHRGEVVGIPGRPHKPVLAGSIPAPATIKKESIMKGEDKYRPHRLIVCSNCGRERTDQGGGMCFLCKTAAKGLEGEARETALAAVKLKLVEGKPRKKRKKGAAISGSPLQETPQVEERAQKGSKKECPPVFRIEITLFNDKDRQLAETLKQIALDERRSLPAQVFYMLEKAMAIVS